MPRSGLHLLLDSVWSCPPWDDTDTAMELWDLLPMLPNPRHTIRQRSEAIHSSTSRKMENQASAQSDSSSDRFSKGAMLFHDGNKHRSISEQVSRRPRTN